MPDFNASHTFDAGMVAFSLCGPVGVDLEPADRPVNWRELADRFLLPGDREIIEKAPEDDRPGEFIRLWTRTEALLKWQGLGISALMNHTSRSNLVKHIPCTLELQPGNRHVAHIACSMERTDPGKFRFFELVDASTAG